MQVGMVLGIQDAANSRRDNRTRHMICVELLRSTGVLKVMSLLKSNACVVERSEWRLSSFQCGLQKCD